MSFYYPESYKISERRLTQNVDVKLIANDNSHNIIITEVPKEATPSSLDELHNTYLQMVDLRGQIKLSPEAYISKIERKNINSREFLSFLITTEVYDEKAVQEMYLYVKKGKQINFIVSSGTGGYSSVLNYIIKNFELK
tara:strand:+ start:153 stop:569 length:417 start_codon:yes stop_codon:yes gene_type:complete